MEPGYDDDAFDWTAAVAEIDEACSKSQINRGQESTGVHASGHQTGAHHPRFIGENSSSTRLSQLSNSGQVASGKAQQKSLLSYLKVVEPKPVVLEATRTESKEGFRTENPAGVDIDLATATTWIYPANIPCRQYQFAITKTALFTNTIVSLPTGLGKTLIAAVVMYNYYRWFPTGKIVFTAPSRPLVLQQIEACHNIMGIPQEMTIDMTGQMSPPQRAEHWQNRRVFFVTPQCLEKDIQSGTCPVREMVCLVVDEAHRATGNFSYCIVVRELLAANVKLRTLALTATPGSKQATIQAVVDNLQISCLEYRDENDTDVCQYTHNRKLEVIQVAMNAEATTIKDMFLEILSPLVDKLIKLGVFYSRELAKILCVCELLAAVLSIPEVKIRLVYSLFTLSGVPFVRRRSQPCCCATKRHGELGRPSPNQQLSPYEFITAREKFRQAPPQALGQHQYREVESHFSIAITLYHTFKLLHSHGIRPALEMLQTKLQQGTLRLLAKHSRLLQIKKLMQESVGHGAPSPKLVKIEEIILLHFREHNPLTTRVIIFTNYRESVKDIMEALQKLHVVKAMEFIGQSSGKTSKGQTQKMQQAVLQKFRAGGYNTIVATCIAEEGLDIMEVDLVICFDANVSPLRMIQRMGRTGRKRDGRVALVLASEGAEMQGYIRKQAKNKALGKHMQHGGVNSFTFHPSPRMVPHVFRPEVQMMEMSIEQYVPRGKKTHPASSATFDPGVHELREEEKAILQRYAVPPHVEAWKPSLIAFPRYQLLPTPVCVVKHSSRTTSMLIDVLQGLQEPAFAPAGKQNLPNQFELSSLDDALLSSRDKSVDPPTLAGKDHTSGTEESLKEGHYLDGRHNCEDNEDSNSPYVVPEGEFLAQGLNILDKGPAIGIKGANHNCHAAETQADAFALDKAQISEEPTGNLATIISHQILFSTRIVFMNSAGELKIASPPEWPPAHIRTSFDHQNRFSSQISLPKQIPESCDTAFPCLEERIRFDDPEEARIALAVTNLSSIPSSVTKVPEKLSGGGEYETVALNKLPKIDVSNNRETTPLKSSAQESEEFIAATPEDKLPQTTTVHFPTNTQATFISPRPDPLHQAVPCLSPTIEIPVISKQLVTPPYTSKLRPPLPPGSALETPVTSTSECIDDNSRKVMQFLDNISFGQRGTSENLRTAKNADSAFRAGSSLFMSSNHTHEALQSPAKPKMLNFGDFVIATENNLNSSSICEGDGKPVLSSDLPSPQVRIHHQRHQRLQEQLPNKQANENVDGQQKTSHGLTQGAEMQVLSGEVLPSGKRPQRKFKRLRKARELVVFTPSTSASKRRLGDNRRSKSTVQLERPSKLGKVMRKFRIQPYIDEEAEVSADEEISTEDDEDDDSLDEETTPDGFIDTCNTQHLRSGSVDMMAVYRQSLLTQSPMVGGLTTPVSTTSDTLVSSSTGGSDSNQSVELSSRSKVQYSGPGPAFIASSRPVGSHSSHLFKCPRGKEDSSAKKVQMCATPTTSFVQDQNADIGNRRKLEMRKRKLSFHLQEDENLFAGLDLDALEEEASHQARARSTQVTCSIAPIPSFDLGIDS